jgi:hypothetical protein
MILSFTCQRSPEDDDLPIHTFVGLKVPKNIQYCLLVFEINYCWLLWVKLRSFPIFQFYHNYYTL